MTEEILLGELQQELKYQFSETSVLGQALTHKSHANEKAAGLVNTVRFDNERLEFLGDAVLDLAMSDLLMARFSTDAEGALSKKRASLVNEDVLSRIALELKLDRLIRLGKGEAKSGGVQKPRILASTLEALIGALFIDGGYQSARAVVDALFQSRLEEIGRSDVDFKGDFKTRLQERLQETHHATPVYRVEKELGPDHDKTFEVTVRLQDQILGLGSGRSKKAAEQDAADRALSELENRRPENKTENKTEKLTENQTENEPLNKIEDVI